MLIIETIECKKCGCVVKIETDDKKLVEAIKKAFEKKHRKCR